MGSLERFVICCLCRANCFGVLSDKSDMVFSSAMFRRGFFPLLLLLFVYCSSASEVVTVDVVKAKALLTSGHKYLDVRTVEEFKKGHVGSEKILNIPYMFDTPEGRVKNPQFLAEVSAACDKEDHLIVGCQSGVRSLYATVDLLSAGFKDVRNMGGGYLAWVENGFVRQKIEDELFQWVENGFVDRKPEKPEKPEAEL